VEGATLALVAALLLAMQSAAAGQAAISAADLQAPSWSGGLLPNAAFVPPAGSAAAHEGFTGTLRLSETEMRTDPAKFKSASVLGRDPKLFPAVDLTFFTSGRDLVPVTQDVIRAGSAGRGRSFWDVIVQPGEVWSTPEDGGWSRAAFPFALVNSIEGETHNGLATFLYKGHNVSNLRFQIVQQTAPFEVTDYFTASGSVPASFAAASSGPMDPLISRYQSALADEVPVAGWGKLASKVGARVLEDFDSAMPARDIVLAGLDYQGTFYLERCNSAAGPLPWCDRARFGVWSATKALANETALLRLAQKYGAAVFDLRIADFVPGLASRPGWEKVRFEDAIDMATGMGNGSTKRDPNDIMDGYLADPGYAVWYEARSKDEKLDALIKTAGHYPWGPGQVARYRDQDMFLLGVAMDNFLKSKEGPAADLWMMLQTEVFAPIGIHYAPVNRTIEPDGTAGHPLMAYGYYPTIGDMVKIARLYQNEGRFNGNPILYAPRIKELAAGPTPRGLPTGEIMPDGETLYTNAFWVAPYHSPEGCTLYYPRMLGWGGNLVALLPGGLTGIRLAKSADDASSAVVDTAGMARVANRLVKFCP
jgi:hypothetical protein